MYFNTFIFSLVLLIILIILIIIKILFKYKKIQLKNIKNKEKLIYILSYGYMLTYSIIRGLLIFFGLKYYNKLIDMYINHKELTCLIIVTLIILYCIICEDIIKNIIENLIKKKLLVNDWDHIKAFIIGRLVVIILIYLILKNIINK